MKKYYLVKILVIFSFFGYSQVLNQKSNGVNSVMAARSSVTTGNWTTGGTWGGTAPAGGDNIAVNHAVTVNTNIAITGTLTVNSTGSLIDPAGGTNYTLDVTNNAVVNIYGNVTFGGAVRFQNNAVIHIYAPSNVTFGAFSVENNVTIIIDAGATLTVNGNMTLQNDNAMTVNGSIQVNGNITTSNNATSAGSTGTISSTGTMTTNNGSDIMGFTGNCTTGPCIAAPGLFGTLPVELIEFKCAVKGNSIGLFWTTASEHNNSYFTLERSSDGNKFEEVTRLNSLAYGGNSNHELSYNFEDNSPLSGVSYYRLKQTDINGDFEYFSTISVDYLPSLNIKFTVFPNPNSGEFFVDFSGIENNHEVQLLLNDPTGKVVYETIYYFEESSKEVVKIRPENKLSSGIYYCTMIIEGVKTSVKVIVK